MSMQTGSTIFDESFILQDARGVPHKYDVIYHPGDEGYRLSVELTTLGLPLLSSLEDGKGSSLVELLTKIDLTKLTERVLRHTHRDGMPLGQPVAFAAAYKANYQEAYQAVAKVVALNRFFPQLDTFLKGEKEQEKE